MFPLGNRRQKPGLPNLEIPILGVPILEVKDLSVSFPQAGSGNGREVLADVSFELAPGEVVGLLGESGCGKSTVALSILRALPPEARINRGSIAFGGHNLFELSASEMRKIRGAKMSIIFQEPALALNPVMRAGMHIIEVLRAHRDSDGKGFRERAKTLLEQVEIAEVDRIFNSYPHQLSGGEAQRVLIAQALACQPMVLIADEPTASLDSTTQAEVLQLLARLRRDYGLTLLFITHNPALLLNFADRVMVMNAGRIFEHGATTEVFRNPVDSFTKALIFAMAKRSAARTA